MAEIPLGWDLANKAGYAEAYKDVIHEDAIKIGGATKAPDYCFRIGGARKFFVEAKKPAVSIKEDFDPAYQLRRYAWSAKLPLSILTDFGEFAVYDCRVLPKPSDKPDTGRIIYFTYTDYREQWDEIAGLFSREAVLRGSFDKFAEAKKASAGPSRRQGIFDRDRDLARRPGQKPRPAQSQTQCPGSQLCRAAHHRPNHFPAHVRGPRRRKLWTTPSAVKR